MSEAKTIPTIAVPHINPKELAAKGEAVYERMKEQLEKEHYGKFIAIEPESGDYEIADRAIDACSAVEGAPPRQVALWAAHRLSGQTMRATASTGR
jgi:hypothetical protein